MRFGPSTTTGREPADGSASPAVTFHGEKRFRVGDCDFFLNFPLGDVPHGHLSVMKSAAQLDDYVELCRSLRPKTVVELGIHSGGSTALLSELLHPEKLVSVELSAQPVEPLTRYIEQRSLQETVRPYYGVDQSDRARLTEILDREFGDRPIDLVIDDASHLYTPSLASFEVLFPRLAADGTYIVEDWRWEHEIATGLVEMLRSNAAGAEAAMREHGFDDLVAGKTRAEIPFSRLLFELVLARADGHAVTEISMNQTWVVVRRGTGALDRESFRLRDLYHNHFDQLGTVGLDEG